MRRYSFRDQQVSIVRTVESIVEVERRDFDPRLRPESGSGWLTTGRRQLQEVMRRAHQRPLGGDLADPSKELPIVFVLNSAR